MLLPVILASYSKSFRGSETASLTFAPMEINECAPP